MRDNLMVGLPENQITPEPLPPRPVSVGGPSVALLARSQYEIGYFKSLLFSIGAHLGLVILIWLTMFILQFLGINLMAFDRPHPVRDIEFQLVTAPDEKPRDPNTRNRAEQNSRSGGEKVPNLREAQPQRKAGNPQPHPKPQPQLAQQPSKPQRQTPRQPSRPVAQPRSSEQARPTPPKPRATAPRPSPNRQRVAAVPTPLAPIKVPDAPGPVSDTGPLVRGPSGGSSSGSSSGSSAAPATVPGQFSGGGRPSSGSGPSGQGGQGNYSQYGSPGGGGGRPGIDAIAEPDFGPYLAELQRRIRRNWAPPEDREDKTVVLLFTISKDGRLLSINTKRSSGYANADAAARAAVERSAPFRALPPEYRNSSINVEFTFDYNVFTGRSGGISRQ